MTTQQAIEHVAAAIMGGMEVEEAEAINTGDGFAFDADADGQNWTRHTGVKLSDAGMAQAVLLAQDKAFGWAA